jgi:hypothetical protein
MRHKRAYRGYLTLCRRAPGPAIWRLFLLAHSVGRLCTPRRFDGSLLALARLSDGDLRGSFCGTILTNDAWTFSAASVFVPVLRPAASAGLAIGAAVGALRRIRRPRENHPRRSRAARSAARPCTPGGFTREVGHSTGRDRGVGLRRGRHIGARRVATGSTGTLGAGAVDTFDALAGGLAEMTN